VSKDSSKQIPLFEQISGGHCFGDLLLILLKNDGLNACKISVE
jgi:hypothetical protein